MSSSSSTTALIEIEDLKVYEGSNHTLFRGKKVEFGNSAEKRVDSELGLAIGTGKCVGSESKSGSATGKCVGSESKSATGNSSPPSIVSEISPQSLVYFDRSSPVDRRSRAFGVSDGRCLFGLVLLIFFLILCLIFLLILFFLFHCMKSTAFAPRDIHIDSAAQQPDDDEAAKPAVAVDQPFFNDDDEDPMDI